MQQLEIQFFFPLTEQIPLDLDFTDCDKPKLWTFAGSGTSGDFLISNGGSGTSWSTSNGNIAPTFHFKANPESVGYWEVSEGVQVWREIKPQWIVRTMSRVLLGWKWMDK
jgi:hypothetical protein